MILFFSSLRGWLRLFVCLWSASLHAGIQTGTYGCAQRRRHQPKKAVPTVLAFTFLNPHVYLDTVLLVGGLSAQWQGLAQTAFVVGAIIASFVWFFSLGYGARILTPLFERPMAWRILDIPIGSIMWLLATSLITSKL